MREYKFVPLKTTGFFRIRPKEDYQKIIQQHAQEGWRLVQIFPSCINAEGSPRAYELIFERETKSFKLG